jgi:transglutaminase-like putative cysteine protease
MILRAGYSLAYECPATVDMLLMVNVHRSRIPDLLGPSPVIFSQGVVPRTYDDRYGNICTRITAPPGLLTINTDFLIRDSGLPDEVDRSAIQHEIADLPDDVLTFLLGSRYCETDRLSDTAWSLFGHLPPGWSRLQGILDFVNQHITFDYQMARSTRSAWEAYQERIGVCRDFAHLALTFCRCMNIPARYCTGYMGDIGVPLVLPMDFSGWFEVFLGGRWWTADARHNVPRIGRVLMAVGRDATDVPISNSFGRAILVGFEVISEEYVEAQASASS